MLWVDRCMSSMTTYPMNSLENTQGNYCYMSECWHTHANLSKQCLHTVWRNQDPTEAFEVSGEMCHHISIELSCILNTSSTDVAKVDISLFIHGCTLWDSMNILSNSMLSFPCQWAPIPLLIGKLGIACFYPCFWL